MPPKNILITGANRGVGLELVKQLLELGPQHLIATCRAPDNAKVCIVTFISKHSDMSCDVRKPVFGVSDQVRHKPGCTATEDGYRHEISDLESRGIVLSKWRKQRR